MRNVIVSMLLVLFTAFASKVCVAGDITGFVREVNVMSHGANNPTFDLSLNTAIDKHWGIAFWGQATTSWRQFYVGPSFQPTKWLAFTAGVGTESGNGHEDSLRLGWSIWVGRTDWYMLYIGEHGDGFGNRWHRFEGIYNLDSRWGAGFMNEAGAGWGPRLEYNVDKNLKIWVAPLFEDGNNTTFVAVQRSF